MINGLREGAYPQLITKGQVSYWLTQVTQCSAESSLSLEPVVGSEIRVGDGVFPIEEELITNKYIVYCRITCLVRSGTLVVAPATKFINLVESQHQFATLPIKTKA